MSGVPMNMTEWNSRMRAQKEQERKKKTESEEILRGYRGGVSEEDLKLTALKLEERRRQEEAAAVLHNYRVTHTEEQRERPQRKSQDHFPPVEAKHEDVIEFKEGSVAEMAAQFNSPSKVASVAPHMMGGVALALPLAVEEGSSVEESKFVLNHSPIVPSSVSPNDGSDAQPAPTSTVAVISDSLMKSEPEDDDVKDEIEEDEEEEEKKVEGKEPELFSSDQPPLLHHPTVVRLDVNFSFGLITTSHKPILDSYMLAVEEVVRKRLADHSRLSQHVSYNPNFLPFVQSCESDVGYVDPQGRMNVRRVVVTAAVPVFLSNGISIGIAREAILEGLQQAIQSGQFLAIAQGTNGDNTNNNFYG